MHMATSQRVLDFRPSAVVILECSFSKAPLGMMDMSSQWDLLHFGVWTLKFATRESESKHPRIESIQRMYSWVLVDHLIWLSWCSDASWCYHSPNLFETFWRWEKWRWCWRNVSKMSEYCWWKKSCTSWSGEYPIFHRFSSITGGAGFLPSTLCPAGRHFDETLWPRRLRIGLTDQVLMIKMEKKMNTQMIEVSPLLSSQLRVQSRMWAKRTWFLGGGGRARLCP